ncbi:hypothetical protein ACFTWF_23575 [Rhodococcus sp. NPDC056960]|uniref:hypothetical protein n=1 Tax=Rhodococcus sp. NPDC056960 TaxID=3345982 RepID=UPI0036312324
MNQQNRRTHLDIESAPGRHPAMRIAVGDIWLVALPVSADLNGPPRRRSAGRGFGGVWGRYGGKALLAAGNSDGACLVVVASERSD